jgi:gamma-glutamylputrescine oxidase
MLGLRALRESAEHTGSYYAASANWATDYPCLEDDIHCDVAVVGGGFSGVNTALELAERGRDVVLLEANRISWGASGRNGGQIIGGIGHDPERFVKAIGEDGVRTIYQMGIEAREVIRERIDTYAIDCDLKWGYCDVALKPRHMKQFAEWREFEKRIGNPHPYTLLDREELGAFVNSERYLGRTTQYGERSHSPPEPVHRRSAGAGKTRRAYLRAVAGHGARTRRAPRCARRAGA